MKRFILIAITIMCCYSLNAQNRNAVWCFGDSAGIDFSNGIATPISTGLITRGSCTSISDVNGDLLFYAETRAGITGNSGLVFNKYDQLMQNGDSILGQGWYYEMAIITDPEKDSSFYIFSIGVTNSSLPGLFYSKVDFTSADSLGIVTQKNIQLLNFTMIDGLSAIKHGNGRDWWIICRPAGTPSIPNDDWYSYLISPSGVTNNGSQNVGNLNGTNNAVFSFNSEGNKICFVNAISLIELYDFDRCTGVISNTNNIEPEVTMLPYPNYWSCVFSPSGQYLYVTSQMNPISRLWQFDTWAPNIAASKTLIWQVSYPPYTAGALKLAPDNKIYISCGWVDSSGNYTFPYDSTMYYPENMNLGVINSPDSAGLTCDFQSWSFYLGGKRTYWGLPNNPDYDMPRDSGSACDTIQWTGIKEQELTGKGQLYVSYISAWQKAFINAQHLKGKTYMITVTDMMGRMIYKSSSGSASTSLSMTHGGYFTMDLDCSSFSNGMYVVTLITDKEMISEKFIRD